MLRFPSGWTAGMCVGVFNNSDSGSNYEIKQKAEARGSIKQSVKEESLHNLKQKKALTTG